MNFSRSKKTQEINRYFKKFVSAHERSSYFDEPAATIMKNIAQLDEVPFDSDWNYLMTLVQIIEQEYSHHGFVSQDNYFRFEFGDYKHIQDKGMNKMDAIYSCCLKTLNEYWKEEIAPPFAGGAEPFDKDDL